MQLFSLCKNGFIAAVILDTERLKVTCLSILVLCLGKKIYWFNWYVQYGWHSGQRGILKLTGIVCYFSNGLFAWQTDFIYFKWFVEFTATCSYCAAAAQLWFQLIRDNVASSTASVFWLNSCLWVLNIHYLGLTDVKKIIFRIQMYMYFPVTEKLLLLSMWWIEYNVK